jgi:hypothetical protein|tara:strand:- start:560 stop:925 length:366 start_codon:yes stop_codon:yes gene_type:complete
MGQPNDLEGMANSNKLASRLISELRMLPYVIVGGAPIGFFSGSAGSKAGTAIGKEIADQIPSETAFFGLGEGMQEAIYTHNGKIIGTVAGIALGIAAARWATGKMKNYLGLDQTPSNYQEF